MTPAGQRSTIVQSSRAVNFQANSRDGRSSEFFLILGNGRTGSTWLETTLDQLPDVRARQELKLKLDYFQHSRPSHIFGRWLHKVD